MKAKKFARGKRVEIKWLDSTTTDGWIETKTKFDLAIITSVGFTIDCNKTSITISTTLSKVGNCLDPLSIPWGCIGKVKKL